MIMHAAYGGKSMQAHPKTHHRVRLNRSGSALQKCGSKGRDAGPRNVMKSGGILAIPSMFVDVLPVESWNPSIARSNGWRVKLGGLNPGISKAFWGELILLDSVDRQKKLFGLIVHDRSDKHDSFAL